MTNNNLLYKHKNILRVGSVREIKEALKLLAQITANEPATK